ncbi:MAG: methyltransferase domain-containing protein [Alphaproteobacteria bacterium]|nr:methyltransferase domain-containing protein [Alphaproteobacteria bacterium]
MLFSEKKKPLVKTLTETSPMVEQRSAPNSRWRTDPFRMLRECRYEDLISADFHQLFDFRAEDSGNLLDAGCGTANETVKLRRRVPGLKIYGVDLSPNALAIAVTRPETSDATFYQSALESLPFPDGAFDYIAAHDLIEHIDDPARVLRELYRVLKPAGICVLATPNGASLWIEHLRQRGMRLFGRRDAPVGADHTRRPSFWRREFARAGLVLERQIFDGAAVEFQLFVAPARWMPILSRLFEPLRVVPVINLLLCDRVKFRLRKPAVYGVASEVILCCPLCRAALGDQGSALVCPRNHRFARNAAGVVDFTTLAPESAVTAEHSSDPAPGLPSATGIRRLALLRSLRIGTLLGLSLLYTGFLLQLIPLGLAVSLFHQPFRVKSKAELDRLAEDAYWHYHLHYTDYEFVNQHLGLRITAQPNDISRHVTALHDFLDRAQLRSRPLSADQRVAILRTIARAHNDRVPREDRVPLVLLGRVLIEGEQIWEALDVIAEAVKSGGYCQMSISVLLATLRRLAVKGYWSDFFHRIDSPSLADLQHDDLVTEMFDYLIDFMRAVEACDFLDEPEQVDVIRLFYHRWWKVYRHADSQIGLFRAFGNSDQSQHIGALRHIIEFAAHRRAAKLGLAADDIGANWLSSCCEMVLAIEKHADELPAFLLAADYLGGVGRLDEALAHGYRAFNTNSRCLLTQHVLDCVEHALERQSKQIPHEFSLLVETPRRYAGKFCNVPFDEAYINPDGDTFLCCSTMLPVPVGNIFQENTWDRIWNSETAQELRASILNGTFKYCNKRSCPKILNDDFIPKQNLSERWKDIISDQSMYITDTLFADLGYDASCNLSCPQCRVGLIVLDRAGFARLDSVRDGIIDDLLSKLKIVRISSGGEALFSRHFRRVLADINPQRCPNLTHLELLTNGMLFDRRQWETFSNLHYLEILVAFSIDACSKETFEAIRRNGRWEKMIANLEFARKLRDENKIAKFQISYAVQAANFREMPDVVRMAERLHVDDLLFFRLENVGAYSEEDYRSRNVAEPTHPLHQQFLKVTSDPIFQSPILKWHNLRPYFREAFGPAPS